MSEKVKQHETMLVRSENLDQLLLLAGEVIIASSNLGLAYRYVQASFDKKEPVNRETLETIKDLSGSTSLISSNLHRLVQAIRTVELRDLGFRAKKLVRDCARKSGKRIRFEIEGEETVVDKSIVEKLFDPIAHQLRNAVDHGIEDAHRRSLSKKSEEGTIVLRMYNTERETVIEIEDDGTGVDLKAIRRKGIDLGEITESDPFSEDKALELMCRPGVSTAQAITQVSGRGVGMDVVRSRINSLGGSISLSTQEGQGSKFVFRVPLVSAVNIVDGLVVQAGGTMYAFPILSVATTMSVPRESISSTLSRGRMVSHLDQLVPLYDLHELLSGVPAVGREAETLPVMIIEHKQSKIALCVNEFLAPQKLVIIPIDDVLQIPEFSGATILTGRRLGFIIDVARLIDTALMRNDMRTESFSLSASGSTSEFMLPEQELKACEETSMTQLSPPAAPSEQDLSLAKENKEFLLEIEKLLPSLNEALFSLESEPTNGELINAAFRLFHTIKGNFMMLGLTRSGTTIHSVESVLDLVRSAKLPMNDAVMDLLMDGSSFIEELVQHISAGDWSDSDSERLTEKSAELLPKPERRKSENVKVNEEEIHLSREAAYRTIIHRKRKTPCYQYYLEFNSAKQPLFLVACMIYRRFCELGDVLATVPSLSDIEQGVMEGRMKLLFASDKPFEVLESSLSSLLITHYGSTTAEL
jgi:chemotaxis protein histidine kinase CheA